MVDRAIQPGGVLRVKPQAARDHLTKVEPHRGRPPAPHVPEVADPTAPPGSDRVTLSESAGAAWRTDRDEGRAALHAIELGRGAERRPLPLPGPGRAGEGRLPAADRSVADRGRPQANGPPSASALSRVERPTYRPGERDQGRDPGRAPYRDLGPGPEGGVDCFL